MQFGFSGHGGSHGIGGMLFL